MKQIINRIFTRVAIIAVLLFTTIFETAFAADKTDIINYSATSADIGSTASNTWKEFTVTGSSSGVSYYIRSMGTKDTEYALRWNANGYLYMTTTCSGYKLKSITITTTADKNISIFAQNSAYAASPSGTALATLAATSSGATYNFESSYTYLALKGAASSTFITNITVVWEENVGEATTTTISDSGITNTDVYVSTVAGSLSATVTDSGASAIGGATVTWSGNDNDVATINASTGAVTLVGEGTVTFTASYAGESGVYQPSSDTYELTVTSSAPYVQPTEIAITPNYTFWGKASSFSGSTYNSLSGTEDNVTLEWERGEGSTYANTTSMRFYKDNTLEISAPSGYEIKSIVITGTMHGEETFSPTGFDSLTNTWTGSATTVTISRENSGSGYASISQFEITLALASSVSAPTFSPASGTTFGNSGTDVTISAEGGNDIYYTLDGEDPTTSSTPYSSAIHIDATTTIKAIAYDGANTSSVASATYTYVDPDRPGTAQNPYSVAQARAAIDAGTDITGKYATGIVSEIVEYSGEYHNITYNISKDGSTTGDQLQAFRGKGFGGANINSADEVQVGDVVVVYGDLTKYSSTYEFATNNQLVSLYRAASAPSETIDLDLTLNGGRYWATFYNATGRYTLPAGAQAFTINPSKELFRLGTTGDVIPANTAVVIIADKASITLTKSDSASASENGGDNILQGSNETVSVAGLSGTPYVLGVVGGVLGFYEYTGTDIPATKAYYVIND